MQSGCVGRFHSSWGLIEVEAWTKFPQLWKFHHWFATWTHQVIGIHSGVFWHFQACWIRSSCADSHLKRSISFPWHSLRRGSSYPISWIHALIKVKFQTFQKFFLLSLSLDLINSCNFWVTSAPATLDCTTDHGTTLPSKMQAAVLTFSPLSNTIPFLMPYP